MIESVSEVELVLALELADEDCELMALVGGEKTRHGELARLLAAVLPPLDVIFLIGDGLLLLLLLLTMWFM